MALTIINLLTLIIYETKRDKEITKGMNREY